LSNCLATKIATLYNHGYKHEINVVLTDSAMTR